MKKTDLIRFIRQIVVEEIRKELPKLMTEVFQGERIVKKKEAISQTTLPTENKKLSSSLKSFLVESEEENLSIRETPKKPISNKTFTKNPILNELLNSTRPFTSQERTGIPGYLGNQTVSAQMETMLDTESSNRPTPDMGNIQLNNPVSQQELISERHIPLEQLPAEVSVLDVKSQLPPTISKVLSKDYSKFMKLIDKKKRERAGLNG